MQNLHDLMPILRGPPRKMPATLAGAGVENCRNSFNSELFALKSELSDVSSMDLGATIYKGPDNLRALFLA